MDTDSIDFKSDTFSIEDEINDEEYNIPAVKEIPTLESILNDDESSFISEEELTQFLLPQTACYEDHGDASSLGSCNMYRSSRSGSPIIPAMVNYRYEPGHILRHSTLKAVSAQLRSACDRINAGYPSAMTVSSVIGLGTSHGLILVFDPMQTLRWCYEGDIDQCSVSALCFNHDCSRLLAGFARGVILMFDTADGRVLRTMADVHTPSTTVLHLKFTDIPSLALCSDSGGSVFELNFKRTLGIRGVASKCIFSGSRGEVCCIEPLLLHHLNSHPLHGTVIVAMATLTKLIIITIRPYTRLLLTHTVTFNPHTLPLLSWQFVVIQLSENSRIMDPVLAFARDASVYFYQVNVSKTGKVQCTALQKLDLEYSLLSCHWLNTRTIAALDTKEQMHLIDVRTKQELERLDLSSVGLVYNSSHFKGISTGGNVSKAMAVAGEKACYNTVQSYSNQILLLGVKSVHVVSIRNWIERLDTLVDKGRFEDAVRLGMEFLQEKEKTVLGLRGPHHQRYKLVKDKVIDILITYVDLILNGGCTQVPIADAINTVINVAIDLEHPNILFDRLWEGFEYKEDSICKEAFLHGLSVSILDAKLSSVPPAIMQQLVDYLSHLHQWKELEICILNVDMECIDIQQTLQLCRQNSLSSGLISIWNRGMKNYTSPLQELLTKLELLLQSGTTEAARDLGNTLLVYISCCFSGHAYPRDELDAATVEQVRSQIFQFLCTQHTVNANENEFMYPYLRTFLKFDMKEFLNVLSMAFADHSFNPQFKQRLIDILILIVFESKTFKAHEVGWLFTFLRRLQISNNSVRPINVDIFLYDKVIDLLATTDDPVTYDERQQAFLDLMQVDNFQHFQPEQLLSSARCGEFYQVCSVLHECAGEHGQVLRCYLLDNSRKYQVFEYLTKSKHKDDIRPYVIDNLEALLEINSEKTGAIIASYYEDAIEPVASQISGEQLFHFLKGAMSSVKCLNTSLTTKYMQLQCSYCDEVEVLEFVDKHDNLQLEHAIEASERSHMNKVTAKLMERHGNYQGAFDVLFLRLQNAISQGSDVEEATEDLVGLIRRGSTVLHPKNTWLPLLQCLLNLNSHDLLRRVLGSADLNLATELHLLLQHTSGTLGDFRNLITGLLDKCSYELSMLKCVNRVVYSDIHSQLENALRTAYKAVSSPQCCSVCQHRFMNKFLIFRCGHGYHAECMQPSNSQCIVCFPS